MTEAFGDDLDRDAGLEEQRRVSETQVAEADADAGEPVLRDEPVEGAADVLGVKERAVGSSEDEERGVTAVALVPLPMRAERIER